MNDELDTDERKQMGVACTSIEKLWLSQRGARTEEDVGVDADGRKWVFMGNGKWGEQKKVYIPVNMVLGEDGYIVDNDEQDVDEKEFNEKYPQNINS